MFPVHADFNGQAYQPQEDEVYFNDGRETALLHFVFGHAKLHQMRGNPPAVVHAIDEYARTHKYLMNIGEHKSPVVIQHIERAKPKVMVELGSYVGYSAIAFAHAVRANGGDRYFCLENNAEFAAVISLLVDLAGLKDFVTVVVGDSSDSLRRLHQDGTLTKIDMLLLDHVKTLYTRDLKMCEELGLVAPGSVLVADNVVKPGVPDYLDYVRSSVREKKQRVEAAKPGDDVRGNPRLEYESTFIEGWEPAGVPDALEITRCIGLQT